MLSLKLFLALVQVLILLYIIMDSLLPFSAQSENGIHGDLVKKEDPNVN